MKVATGGAAATYAGDADAVLRRATVRGKSLYAGPRKLVVRGVTYGPFRPREDGHGFPDDDVVASDFARMAASGLNAIRTYETPPRQVLDAALANRLRVLVGLPWEEHVAFLDQRRTPARIEGRIREGVASCAGHPAVLAYAVGNEIPSSIVRWHGTRRTQRFLRRLYGAAKDEDPHALVTYVNYPSTEYLELPFLDFECFNVYLETQTQLEAYLARLQNIAHDRPLLIGELGLDSRRNGERAQAASLESQIRTALDGACAGAFVFSWTDEWHRGGVEIEDWDFGLTDRQRRPKPALAAVHRAFSARSWRPDDGWPAISVVVCSRNGGATLRECVAGIRRLSYPDYEAILVDDGSTDDTRAIGLEAGLRVISTEGCGLATARNIGFGAATGEIVAYIDDDARPDPDWLVHLASTFRESGYAAVGGPNIPPADEGFVARCVAASPGAPTHVLVSDREAEHIPGCNMAFRRDVLAAVGGFDTQFTRAGDDVDLCWRLQDAGWTLGFNPGAVVLHRRRGTVRGYLRQQRGYGGAEAQLERKWPQKYNLGGHLTWGGRAYVAHASRAPGRMRIYYGTWGTGLFQPRLERGPSLAASLLRTPELSLILLGLAALSCLGLAWPPLYGALVPLAVGVGALLAHGALAARRAAVARAGRPLREALGFWALTAFLHLLQPPARLWGRLEEGLTPWRRRGRTPLALPRLRTFTLWSELWQAPHERLLALERMLREEAVLLRGGDFDRWDFELWGGWLGRARIRTTTEEHGRGRQLMRLRVLPYASRIGLVLVAFCSVLAAAAAADGADVAAAVLGVAGLGLLLRLLLECSLAVGLVARGVAHLARERQESVLPAASPSSARRRLAPADRVFAGDEG